MKKLICCVLLAILLCCATALAEVGDRLKVVNCDEYVTLRSWPDTSADALARIPLGRSVSEVRQSINGFTLVGYRGQSGYVLSNYLRSVEDYRGVDVDLTDKQRYNINLFLSNFTETGFAWNSSYDDEWSDEAMLTEFAVDHCWFNRQNRLEWGDYFSGNNVRLPRDQIAPIVKKYFGLDIKPSKSLQYIDYKDGYYYWEETGGHTNDGYACLDRVEKLDKRRYSVWFEILGVGEEWDNDVCYYTTSEAMRAYMPYDLGEIPWGHAVINVGSSGLGDREDWRIERFTTCRDWHD